MHACNLSFMRRRVPVWLGKNTKMAKITKAKKG
jgi:hypothetical protein